MKANLQALQAFLSHLSKREKVVLYSAAFFVCLTLIDRLLVSPISGKLKSLDEQIKEKELAIASALRIVSQKEKISSASAHIDTFSTAAGSDEEEITSLLKEIEKMANKSSVYLIDLKPSGIKGGSFSRKYLINLNCEAQMEQLVDFMYAIENSNRLLTIEKYQISPKSKESSVAKCGLSLSKLSIP